MNIPENLKYTKDHEWIQVLSGNEAKVGITEFAAKELGDIVYIEIETLGDTIEKEETFGTIEAVKTVSDMFMPVTGTILEVNEAIKTSPDIVNKDPYNDGWFIKIEMKNPDELNELLTAEQYKELIGNH